MKKRLQPHRPTHGFTLIEMLIVVIILGIVGLLALPKIDSMLTESKVDAAAGELIQGLEYARSLAVRYQRPFGVRADTGLNQFAVIDYRYRADPLAHPGEKPPVTANGVVLDPVGKGWYIRAFNTLSACSGVALTSVPSGGELYFFPDGHSSEAASTYVVSLAGFQRTLTVDGIIGKITAQ
jgi:type II secretion system protein H